MRIPTVVLLLFCCARSASADLVIVSYVGRVSSENLVTGNMQPLTLGTRVSGTFVYDTNATESIIDSGRSRFSNALVEHRIEVEGTIYTQDGSADVSIDNNSISNFDAFRTSNDDFLPGALLNGMRVTTAPLAFIDNSETVFNSTVLPTAFDIQAFDTASVILGFEDPAFSSATVYTVELSAVPEPDAFPAAMFALAMLSTRRRNRLLYRTRHG